MLSEFIKRVPRLSTSCIFETGMFTRRTFCLRWNRSFGTPPTYWAEGDWAEAGEGEKGVGVGVAVLWNGRCIGGGAGCSGARWSGDRGREGCVVGSGPKLQSTDQASRATCRESICTDRESRFTGRESRSTYSTGNQHPPTGSHNAPAGKQDPTTENQDPPTNRWILIPGRWILIPGLWIWIPGRWILIPGRWILIRDMAEALSTPLHLLGRR